MWLLNVINRFPYFLEGHLRDVWVERTVLKDTDKLYNSIPLSSSPLLLPSYACAVVQGPCKSQ